MQMQLGFRSELVISLMIRADLSHHEIPSGSQIMGSKILLQQENEPVIKNCLLQQHKEACNRW